jgi:DNA-3-methyladenine glycosylase II
MEALLHPDIWPAGDLAMMKSYKNLKGLKSLPDKEEAIKIGERYKPWRSVAARLLWHYYINENNLKVEFDLIK